MPTRVFLDSKVFLFAFERPESNSHRVLGRLAARELLGVVTDRVVREVGLCDSYNITTSPGG